jgi:sugar/nucleoside kinase (ribokinase family)
MSAVAVVGNLSRDRVAGSAPRAGGAAYHCARALGALDARATIVTKASEPWLVEALEELGVPVRWRASSSSPAFAFEYDGDARRMVVEELGEPWTREDVRGWVADAIGGCGWVHVGALARSDFPADALAELARGRRLSYDGQGLVRPARTGELVLDADYDPELLRSVSIVKLSEEEAAVVGTQLGVPEVIVTLGSRGALVHADGSAEHVSTRALAGVDPTGSGDMFAAAYLVARAEGADPVTAAARACEVVGALLAAA